MEEKKQKIAILTINDDGNYGNRLQNYALQTALKNLGFDVETVRNIKKTKRNIKNINIKKIIVCLINNVRTLMFKKFNQKHIFTSKYVIKDGNVPEELEGQYDYFVVGSDQVWNYTYDRFSKVDLLEFVTAPKRISYAASFGVSDLENNVESLFKENLNKFKSISVREERGKEIVEQLTNRNDVEVVLDPTLLLTKEEWQSLVGENKNKKQEYLLTYFLGETPENIKQIAQKHNLKIKNLLKMKEINNFISGPKEFVRLIENAKLVCTDSYHAVIFSIIFGTPFLVYDRKSSHKSMTSRLDTLLKLCHLENRKNSNIKASEMLKVDYSVAYENIKKERESSYNFLKRTLNIE